MRYLVISACADVRTGKEFEAGVEFLPEPDPAQALRLVNAGCLRVIPDDAPELPGTAYGHSDAVIAAMQGKLEEANSTIVGLNNRVGDFTTQLESLATEYRGARAQLDTANDDLAKIRGERDQLAGRVADLEKDLAEATKPAAEAGAGGEQGTAAGAAETAGKTGKAKA
jgi:hypothetical protein